MKAQRMVIINGREHKNAGDSLTYEEIVQLAFGSIPKQHITVQYTGVGSGVVLPGQSVEIKPGMVIDVVDTSRA